jgi:hypothetical protein
MFKQLLSWLFSSKNTIPVSLSEADLFTQEEKVSILPVEIPDAVAETIAEEAVPVKKKRKYYKKKKKLTV